jgi:hypothetical protein
MVISNAGSIVLSLPAKTVTLDSPTAMTAQQVRLLALSNTVSRLLVGSIADWMSPIGHQSREDDEEPNVRRRKFSSRVMFLAIFCLTLSIAFAYGAGGMKTRPEMWPLRYVIVHVSRGGLPYLQSQRRSRYIIWCNLYSGVSILNFLFNYLLTSLKGRASCLSSGDRPTLRGILVRYHRNR